MTDRRGTAGQAASGLPPILDDGDDAAEVAEQGGERDDADAIDLGTEDDLLLGEPPPKDDGAEGDDDRR